MSDSGKFGSRADMDKIGRAQATHRKAMASKPKPNLKSMIGIPKYQSKGTMGKVKKAAGKMFGL